MKLHGVHDTKSKTRHQWCGPTALAAVTGCGYQTALDVLREVTGRRAITRTWNGELVRAFSILGWVAEVVRVDGKPTLARWLRQRTPEVAKSHVVVNVTKHYVAVLGRKVVDNKTKDPVFLREYPHRRLRVRYALLIRRVA